MTRRSRAREVALQLLFWHDANPTADRPAVERFVRERLREPANESFCLSLFDGITGHAAEIDGKLTEAAENWRVARMAAVDRNVLRLGAYELLYGTDTPPAVALNEAIELARRYGSKDSPVFVNGVLDRINRMRRAECIVRSDEVDLPDMPAESAPADANTPNSTPPIPHS
jgi:transcription antitermination protein NusB